jgi:two-component system phosphate regulon sensor histidine kinase PhoR
MLTNKSLRVLVILATLSIVGITATQIYWVRKAFDLNQDQFERDVRTALYHVAEELFLLNDKVIPKKNPVEQVAGNYFIVNLAQEFSVPSLEELVQSSLAQRNIESDFEYGVYNCNTDQMVYCNYVNHTAIADEDIQTSVLPKSSNQEYYFAVYFPGQYAQIINRMGVWVYSSLVLLLVIVFFAFTLFVILKQRRLSEVQRDFINNMTHEFKTPISTINISAGVIQNPEIVSNPQRLLNYATIIRKESDRLQNQVDRVLQAATVDNIVKHLSQDPLDVHELIAQCAESFGVVIAERGGEIALMLEAPHSKVIADQLHLSNVFHNLIDNALKYSERTPKITINSSDSNGWIAIKIRDVGIGIAKEQQHKVFDKFYRIPTGNQHDVKGFGLGLYYVKYIIDSHGGKISLTSSEEGTCFEIILPTDKP